MSEDILDSLTDLESLLAFCLMAEVSVVKGPTFYVIGARHWCYFVGGYHTNFLNDLRAAIRDVVSIASAERSKLSRRAKRA